MPRFHFVCTGLAPSAKSTTHTALCAGFQRGGIQCPQHTRYSLTAEHNNDNIYLHTRVPCESPLSLATEKSAQLYALLFLARDSTESGIFGDPNPEIQLRVLQLAIGLAHETLVLSELAAEGVADDDAPGLSRLHASPAMKVWSALLSRHLQRA